MESFLAQANLASDAALAEICNAAATIFGHGISMQFLSHGAIARGRVWWTPQNQIVMGPAIAQAYELAESLDCFGVALDASCPQTTAASAAIQTLRKREPPIELRWARPPTETTYRWRIGFDAARSRVQAEGSLSAEQQSRILVRFDNSLATIEAMLGQDMP
jgi:hypothetical protein